MLEIKQLSKVYKNKKGIDVKALDNINVNFPEKGMIFLLGKSGSGKSTLLNVCGGLDEATSGEIIVKGKSSKNFTQSDFDSYRNTFIGFIFQEYNILNEFTVEENIALALELQGKSKDKEAISKLLSDVDLIGFEKRKPNTLSGGQKQRIAIARALIKEPEIIMADEPTGALDSTTGKQVLDTLKKLSKDKLVIVVSHDREFAENYADRIIELKDGKIISDFSKTYEEQIEINSNISVVGEVLHIKNGTDLTEKDMKEIKNFLSDSKVDIIVAKGKKDVENFKTVNRITKSGKKEVFKETKNQTVKQYNKADSKFIRSKLPLKHAIRIGASSLKYKPIRLFFTILLCTISFIMFGILSTLTFYDRESTFKQTFKDSDFNHVTINKEYRVYETMFYENEELNKYPVPYQTNFSEKEFEQYKKEFGNNTYYGFDVNYNINTQMKSDYWIDDIKAIANISEDNDLYQKIEGTYPKNDNEICITNYTANVIYNNRINENLTNKLLNLNSYKDIIGKNIYLGNQLYKVVGIIDSGKIDPRYDALKKKQETNIRFQNEYIRYLEANLHLTAFVTENKALEMSKETTTSYIDNVFSQQPLGIKISGDKSNDYSTYISGNYAKLSLKPNADEIIKFNDDAQTLANDETIVSDSLFLELLSNYYIKKDSLTSDDYKIQQLIYEIQTGNASQNNVGVNYDKSTNFNEEVLNKKINELINLVKQRNINLKIEVSLYENTTSSYNADKKYFKVVGVWKQTLNKLSNRMLVSEEVEQQLWDVQKKKLSDYVEFESKYDVEITPYKNIFIAYDKSDRATDKLFNMYSNDQYSSDDSRINIVGTTIESLQMADGIVESLSKVFLYLGIGLAIFSILLFSNFITISITYKKKEIGVLRAIGARSIDVFKIFFAESFIITLICLAFSMVGNIIIANILNGAFASELGISLFVFGIISILVLVSLAILTAFFATFIPVYNAARKKPVESIRAI